MVNENEFICNACNIAVLHDPTKRHIPIGWCNRNIEGIVYLLCNSCGIGGPLEADISPSLCEKFSNKGVFFEGCKQWTLNKNNEI